MLSWCFTVNINGHTSYHDGKYYETCSDCLLSEDTTFLPDGKSKGRYFFLFSKTFHSPTLLIWVKIQNVWLIFWPFGISLSSPPHPPCFFTLSPLLKHGLALWSHLSWRSLRSRQSVYNSCRSTTLEEQVSRLLTFKDIFLILSSLYINHFSLFSDLCPDEREPAPPAAENTESQTDEEPTAQ